MVKSLRDKVDTRIDNKEPAKKAVTLFLNTKNYNLLRDKCQKRNNNIKNRKTKGKTSNPSDIVDELIALYLQDEI